MISIISHDAGGAELLSSWVNNNPNKYNFILDGPAVEIFKRKVIFNSNIELNKDIIDSEYILCGTSWDSNLERLAIKNAKKYNIKTIAYLDHWVNYKERFLELDELILPDEIWVNDIYARDLAKNTFPNSEIKIVVNYFFEEIENYFNSKEKTTSKSNRLLYVCEPISEHALKQHGDRYYWGYTEFDALNYLFDNIGLINQKINKITIRPHPSENGNKYNHYINKNISISDEKFLLNDIHNSDIIVGAESMALVVAVLAKKRVISCIPPQGLKCRLPFDSIEHLIHIISNYSNN
jgi:hypothetical protein